MIGILFAKIRLFFRSPWTFIMTTIMSIGFAFIIGGTTSTVINVPVHLADSDVQHSLVWEELKASDVYNFQTMTEKEMEQRIKNGKSEFGLLLNKEDFQVLVGIESANVNVVRGTVQKAYTKQQRFEQIATASGATSEEEKANIMSELKNSLDNPPFSLETKSFRGEDAVIIDNTFHSLFGFTLFFVIYTIAYNVLGILVEKQEGVFDRVILSPVKKWEVYVANLVYSFLTGYLQVIIVFLVFRYLIGVDFNGKFVESLLLIIPYVFSIVALSILVTALVKTVQQFNAVIPIVAVSMAMIGGAYWPLEIVGSEFMLALSKFDPITYGMKTLNGVAVYGHSFTDLLYPISILLLMGVVMTGLGIHLMEKRHV